MVLSKVQTFFQMPTERSFSSLATSAARHTASEEGISFLSIFFWGAIIWYCCSQNTSSRPIKTPTVMNPNSPPCRNVSAAAAHAMPTHKSQETRIPTLVSVSNEEIEVLVNDLKDMGKELSDMGKDMARDFQDMARDMAKDFKRSPRNSPESGSSGYEFDGPFSRNSKKPSTVVSSSSSSAPNRDRTLQSIVHPSQRNQRPSMDSKPKEAAPKPAVLASAPSFRLMPLNQGEITAPPGGPLPVSGTHDKSVSNRSSFTPSVQIKADMQHLLVELECLYNEIPVEGKAPPDLVLAWKQRLNVINEGIRQSLSVEESLPSAPPAYEVLPDSEKSNP